MWRVVNLTKNKESEQQREKFWKTLEESYWDVGLLAETLIKLREKDLIK